MRASNKIIENRAVAHVFAGQLMPFLVFSFKCHLMICHCNLCYYPLPKSMLNFTDKSVNTAFWAHCAYMPTHVSVIWTSLCYLLRMHRNWDSCFFGRFISLHIYITALLVWLVLSTIRWYIKQKKCLATYKKTIIIWWSSQLTRRWQLCILCIVHDRSTTENNQFLYTLHTTRST